MVGDGQLVKFSASHVLLEVGVHRGIGLQADDSPVFPNNVSGSCGMESSVSTNIDIAVARPQKSKQKSPLDKFEPTLANITRYQITGRKF